jgi:predicted RNase H-like nuclease (RuvC/YqgF family)
MSNVEGEVAHSVPFAEWDRLELTVRRLVDDHEAWRRRAQSAEQRVRDLESALEEFSSGTVDPLSLTERVRAYEEENRALARRLEQAREVVERIQSRLQFLEEDR